MTALIYKLLDDLRASLPREDSNRTEINVPERLSQVLHNEAWSEDEFSFLGNLLRKADITGRLKVTYRGDWTAIPGSDDLQEPWQSLAALLVYRGHDQGWGRESETFRAVIRLNALAKLLDMASAPWISEGSALRAEIEEEIARTLLAGRPYSVRPEGEVRVPPILFSSDHQFEEIPLTVLFYEGPIARAYLETLYACGLKPDRIINLIASRDIVSGRPAGNALPMFLRIPYLAYRQQRQIHHWPRYISRHFVELHEAISRQVEVKLGFSRDTMVAAAKLHDLSRYSGRVASVLIDSLGDRSINERLQGIAPGLVLFTGGGIMPADVLAIPGLRLLHVHPGFLPKLRGADCTLWSSLLFDRASASCFFMATGIDTGAIIDRCWLPQIKIQMDIDEHDLKTLYRAVYAYLDPWVRAYCLRKVLTGSQSISELSATPQNEAEGTTFHFMHDRFKRAAINNLFHADGDAS